MANNIKVLLIDDSEMVLGVTQAVLDDAGFETRATTSLAKFEQALGDWTPDLILCDVTMPDMSGAEVCRALKAHYETMHVPIVLFSSKSQEELARLADECEADGFLSKQDGIDGIAEELELLYDSLAW